MSKGTEGIFYVGRAILGALRRGPEVSTPANARTSPSQGRGDHHSLPPSAAIEALTARRGGTRKLRSAAGGISRLTMCCRQAQGRRIAGQSPDVKAL
jgi:hypothetical protein